MKIFKNKTEKLEYITEIKNTAYYWYNRGFNPIPIKFATKEPDILEWKKYQNERVTVKEIEKWFSGDKLLNVGVICRNNLICLDFDKTDTFHNFFKFLGVKNPLNYTYIEQSRSGRYHVLFICSNINSKKYNTGGYEDIELEILAQGDYFVTAPSIHHLTTPDNIIKYKVISYTTELKEFPDLELKISEFLKTLNYIIQENN